MIPSSKDRSSSITPNQLQPKQTSNKLEKLRIIKPFEEKQLLSFYPNSLLDTNEKFIQNFNERFYIKIKDHNEYYDMIIRLDKFIERFKDINTNIKQFIKQIRELENKCWCPTEHHLHQSNRCGDGQMVESNHKYTVFHLDPGSSSTLDRFYYLLRERLVNEHVVHSYFEKYFQLRFEVAIYEASNIIKLLEQKSFSGSNYELYSPSSFPDDMTSSTTNCGSSVFDDESATQIYIDPHYRLFKEKLLDLFSALFTYYRQITNPNETLKLQCYKTIVHLFKELSTIATFYDRLFFLNQILRCPAGSSSDFAPLIEPLDPLPLKTNQYDLGRQYVDYGVTVITTILSPINNFSHNNQGTNNVDSWILIDSDLDDEIINPTLADLTENDIITYLSCVPFREILQFMSLINENENFDEEQNEHSSIESSMIRLFAFSTRLIQIFRNGLQNFNCLRFKKLTLYLASMIKQIIKTISDNWKWCKEKFTTKDQALLIRLQVEFDHFMLRSIMAILSTNRRGVWPLLAKIDFEGVSEPMLWQILWVVYNNGRNEQNEMSSGLCPYMSANYWKDKFGNHVQWKFVFIEKLSVLSLEEASGLIDFFYNMAISRSFNETLSMLLDDSDNINAEHHNDDFLHEITERFAEICLMKKFFNTQSIDMKNQNSNQILLLNNQEFYSTKGVACLIKLITTFKSMLIVLLQFIQNVEDETNLLIQPCFDLLTSIIIDDWKPEPKLFSLLYKWLLEKPYENVYNKFARILLTKIGWNQILLQNDQCLMIPVQQQQIFALKIYQAVKKNIKIDTTNTNLLIEYPRIESKNLSVEQRLKMAQSDNICQFGCWSWSMLLSLRLHPLDLIPDESYWDDIIYGTEQQEKYVKIQKHWTMQQITKFNYDPEMVDISIGIENNNPYAIFIGTMISDLLFNSNSTIDVKKLTEITENLSKNGHFLPTIQILYHFLPFSFENASLLSSNNNLISSILNLLRNNFDNELVSIILLQKKHFSNIKYSQQVCEAWTEILFECINQCLNYKSASWFSFFLPQFLLSSSSILNIVDSILLKICSIFNRLAMNLLLENDGTLKLYLQYLTRKIYGRMVNWKLTQLDLISSLSNNSSSSSSWISWYSNRTTINYLTDKNLMKSPWMTPFHLLLRHYLNVKSSSIANQPIYLTFLITEADIRRTYRIWNHLVNELRKKKICSIDFDVIESELVNASKLFEKASLSIQLLPINLVTVYLLKFVPIEQNSLKNDFPHPLIPLLWRQFFSLYFLYTDSLSVIGNLFIDSTKLKLLNDCLNALFDHHNQRWIRLNNERSIDMISIDSELNNLENHPHSANSNCISALLFEDRLVKLYRAYRIWLRDIRFVHYADLDDEQFSKPEIQIKLLNSIVSCNKIFNYHQNIEDIWIEYDHINSFFFLNYVNKLQFQNLIEKHEQYWLELIKPKIQNEFNKTINEENNKNEQNEDNLLKKSNDSSNEINFLVVKRYSIFESDELSKYWENSQFWNIVNHFSMLTSPFWDNYKMVSMNDVNTTNQQDISKVFMVIRQIIDNIVEEARFVENQLEKYSILNNEFQKDIVSKLYNDVTKDLVHRISCDRAEFDASGCSKPALIRFEFSESILNNYIKQKYDLNRNEFDSIITFLIEHIPGKKVVVSIFFMQKIGQYLLRFFDDGPSKTDLNQKKLNQLFEIMTSWINSINLIGIKYHITGQLLDIILDILSKLSNQYMDEVNYFYLNTSLQRNISLMMIQQLSPCLTPSKTSPSMFIEMYKLIGSRLNSIPSQQTIFVLLSKFDVSSWLQMRGVEDKQRFDLLNCLFQCFSFFGTNPSDEFLVTYDLYRKHLQDIILFRFPMYMSHIINFMLEGMTENVLAPTLWNSILHTFGFYTKSLSFVAIYRKSNQKINEQLNNVSDKEIEDRKSISKDPSKLSSLIDFDFQTFDDDLRTYLLRQKLFTSSELYELLQLMHEFKLNLQTSRFNSDFLDHFMIYNIKYLQFLTFISYCWINSNVSTHPDDFSVIWLPFFENWKFWIFPKQNTKFIQWEHFCFTWQLFVNCVQFLLDSFYERQSQILSCLWKSFMNFLLETHSVERTDVEMFESKLLQLNNWSHFYPSMLDMKLMYESVLMNRYSLERLNSFVISKLQWNQILLYSPLITKQDAVEILENLIYTIISLIDQPYIAQMDFHSIPFILLPCDKVKKIIMALLEMMKKRISIDIADNTKHHYVVPQLVIIMRLLKALVLLTSEQNEDNQYKNIVTHDDEEKKKKSTKVIYYSHCIGSFISFMCNQDVDYVTQHFDSIRSFLKDSFEPLRPTIDDFESEDRISIFCELLQPLNEIHDTQIRDKMTNHFLTIFSYMTSQQTFAEIIFSIGKIIYSIKTSVYLLECLIQNYFDLSGDLNYLVDNLEIVHLNKHLNKSIGNFNGQQSSNNFHVGGDIEDFILELIKTKSCLLLLVYLHRCLRHRTIPDICTRRYIYNIMTQCTNHFKFSNSINNSDSFDEAKICFLWIRFFDWMTFDHSAIGDGLNISIHHLSSLKTTLSPVSSNCSLMELPIIYSRISSGSSSPTFNQVSFSSPINNNLSQLSLDIHNEDVSNALQLLLLLCRSLNSSISDSMNRGFFSIFRQLKQPSQYCLFLLQSLVLHGVCTMLETFFSEFNDSMDDQTDKSNLKDFNDLSTDIIRNKLKAELKELVHSSKNRLRGWKKNKLFQELVPLIDKILDLTKSMVINLNQNCSHHRQHMNNIDDDINIDTNDKNILDILDPTFLIEDKNDIDLQLSEIIDNPPIQSVTKEWLRYYIRLSQHQQKRFHTIRRWLLEFYNDHNYIKHFV